MLPKSCVAAVAATLGTIASLALGTGVAAAAPYTHTPRESVSNANPFCGGTFTVFLDDFTPGEMITGNLFPGPVPVFDVVADAHGHAVATATVPSDFARGRHVLVANGDDGERAFADITIRGNCCPSIAAVRGGGNNGNGNLGSGNNGNDNPGCGNNGNDNEGNFNNGNDNFSDGNNGNDNGDPSLEGGLPEAGFQTGSLGLLGAASAALGATVVVRRRRRNQK